MGVKKKKRTHVMTKEICSFCGQEISLHVLSHHAATCWENSEYAERLRAEIPLDIGARDYERQCKPMKWPHGARIRKRFGTFAAFLAWLGDITDDNDYLQIIEEAMHANRSAAAPMTGLTVCERPRRIWEANGHTWIAWGVR